MAHSTSAWRFATVGLAALAACQYDSRVSPGPVAARAPEFAARAADRGGPGANGRHIVTFRGQVPADFNALVEKFGGKVLWASSGSGLATVRGLSASAAATLSGNQSIAAVDADMLLSLEMPKLSAVDAGGVAGVQSADNPAGAVRFARQWNIKAVQADAAWAHGFLGSSSVKIFMLDSGIDYLHADLLGRVDLDRSVDLLGTFETQLQDGSIVSFTESDTVAKYFPGRLAFTDLFFHGTHTGATASSNAVRAAGITSKTTLVAVKVCGYINECPFSSILGGVLYGADNGADVMNLSLGGSIPKKGNKALIRLINQVFAYARSQGVTIVVSAGNAATDLDHNGNTYESFCDTPAVICVSATGPTSDATAFDPVNPRTGPWTDVDAPSYFTNFGRKAIDVAAPGGNSSFGPPLTPPAGRDVFVWAACSQTSLLIDCSPLPIFIVGAQGTSMSAPHVTGTAALLVSILGRHPEQIKARLEESADKIGGKRLAAFYGNGRLNVARAVGAISDQQEGQHSAR